MGVFPRSVACCSIVNLSTYRPLLLDRQVSREMFPFIGECFGNPSSAHALGRACKAAVDNARARVAALLDCTPEEIVFVASGSEADNHAILAAVGVSDVLFFGNCPLLFCVGWV